MSETYSVLFRRLTKLSKNLLAFATHWIANTNKTKCQTFIYLFEKKYISYDSCIFRVFITIFYCCLQSYCRDSKILYCCTVKTVILETAVPCLGTYFLYLRTLHMVFRKIFMKFLRNFAKILQKFHKNFSKIS